MKTRLIVFPTMKQAVYTWHRLAAMYPDMWIKRHKNPLSLTSILGTKYEFCSDPEPDKLMGRHADIISSDNFLAEVAEEKGELE